MLSTLLTEEIVEVEEREEKEDVVEEVDGLGGSMAAVAGMVVAKIEVAEVTEESPEVRDLRLLARDVVVTARRLEVEGAWVKSESSVLGRSTDQSTSKTVER